MPAPSHFDYAVVRVVPHVEREEFVNVGVVLFCDALDYLAARIELDEARLLTLSPSVDLATVREHLGAIPRICAGGADAGPIGALPPRERWHWLVSPRSSILQTSAPHAGLCDSPQPALERLVDQLVRAPRAPGTSPALLASHPAMSDSSDSFERATRLTRVSPTEHEWLVPDGWQQGRGAFGGIVLGAALAAMVADEADEARAPRAFLGDICAPVLPGASRLTTRALRRGRNQSNMACTLEQHGQIVASASAVLAASRKITGAPALRMSAPVQPPFQDVPVIDIRAPAGPVFARHYEYRLTSALPMSGAGDGTVTGWVRERIAPSKVTHAVLLARLDAFFPALFPMETTPPRPMATVSFMAEFLLDPATLDPAQPLYYRARALAQAAGYVVELRELWAGDHPVALNQQSFAILA